MKKKGQKKKKIDLHLHRKLNHDQHFHLVLEMKELELQALKKDEQEKHQLVETTKKLEDEKQTNKPNQTKRKRKNKK